jgi:hypothetical protein
MSYAISFPCFKRNLQADSAQYISERVSTFCHSERRETDSKNPLEVILTLSLRGSSTSLGMTAL